MCGWIECVQRKREIASACSERKRDKGRVCVRALRKRDKIRKIESVCM